MIRVFLVVTKAFSRSEGDARDDGDDDNEALESHRCTTGDGGLSLLGGYGIVRCTSTTSCRRGRPATWWSLLHLSCVRASAARATTSSEPHTLGEKGITARGVE